MTGGPSRRHEEPSVVGAEVGPTTWGSAPSASVIAWAASVRPRTGLDYSAKARAAVMRDLAAAATGGPPAPGWADIPARPPGAAPGSAEGPACPRAEALVALLRPWRP